MINPIKRVCVLGAGQMGTGIGIVAANKGNCQVSILDKFPDSLERSRNFFYAWVAKEVSKGRLNDEKSLLTKIDFRLLEDSHEKLKQSQLIVEAVPEDFALKSDVIKFVDKVATDSETIIASNTSSISITKLAAVTNDPSRVIGLHFMNPVPVMDLVEVIRGLRTSQQVLDRSVAFCSQIKKEPAVALDRPGFVANRILMPYINEAIFTLQEGISSKEDIDKIMKLGTNVPMGPLTLADFIGLDTCLSIIRVLHEQLGDSKYRPAPLLIQMVDAGRLGKKVGQGFYEYK